METFPFDQEIISNSPGETERLGGRLYHAVAPNALVALYGPLGAGKTCFVRGLAKMAGVPPDEVNSPSFTLINEYTRGNTPIYHIDLYRMADPSEFISIGADDYLSGDGIVIIEWAENGGNHIPEDRYDVRFGIIDESRRRLIFSRSET